MFIVVAVYYIGMFFAIIGGIICGLLGINVKTKEEKPRPRWMDNPQTPGEVNQYIDFWGLDVYEGGYGEHKK